MRPPSTVLLSRHGHGGTWHDFAVRQDLVSDPSAIGLVASFPPLAWLPRLGMRPVPMPLMNTRARRTSSMNDGALYPLFQAFGCRRSRA